MKYKYRRKYKNYIKYLILYKKHYSEKIYLIIIIKKNSIIYISTLYINNF